MDKTYFIVSDVHSYYSPLISALEEAGFDYNNSSHILVVNGDLFDRGEDTYAVWSFIKSIPKERRILIRGNHEYLLRDLLENKNYPEWHDVTNRTLKTCFHLAGVKTKETNIDNKESLLYFQLKGLAQFGSIEEGFIIWDSSTKERLEIKQGWKNIKTRVKETGILDWIFSDEWIDYFELDNFIITHAFIPLDKPRYMSMYRPDVTKLSYHQSWRTDKAWQEYQNAFEEATWGCPYTLYDYGFFDNEIANGKTLVVGHWHCYDFRQHYCNKYYQKQEDINYDIFYSKHLIAIDGCTAVSNKCNVLVIKNGKCYQHNKELVEEATQEQINEVRSIYWSND